MLTGWQTSGIVTLQTGRPFTVALLREFDNSGTGISALGFGANDRPNVVGDPNQGPRSPERWFNTAAFAFPPPGTFGNAGRNIVDGPGYHNVNASLVKNTALSETFEFAVPGRVLQSFQSSELQFAGQFSGLAVFRPDHFGTRAAAYSVRFEVAVLELLHEEHAEEAGSNQESSYRRFAVRKGTLSPLLSEFRG